MIITHNDTESWVGKTIVRNFAIERYISYPTHCDLYRDFTRPSAGKKYYTMPFIPLNEKTLRENGRDAGEVSCGEVGLQCKNTKISMNGIAE